jgi:hypothetical protein
MGKLTMRSKIRIYWTTSPGDMGYDYRPTLGENGAWKGPHANYELCSMRKALSFSFDLSKKIGTGTYRMISYQHDGREVALEEIRDVVETAEYHKENR